LAKWLPVTFICVIIVLVCFGVADLRVLAATSQADATLTAAELKDRIEELRWILELILATSGLFTIAQGVAAGFSAKSFADEAKDKLAEIKQESQAFQKRAESVLDEATSQFKTLRLLEDRRREAIDNLPNLDQAFIKISSYSLGGRSYGNLPPMLRQQLLSAERVFPYEFMGRDEPPDVFARNVRRLAQFYSAKFSYERERGSGSLGDIEHALHLLTLAIRKAGSRFYLLNELGNVHVVYFGVLSLLPRPCLNSGRSELQDALNRARGCLEDSVIVQRRQLRAYYNLAHIEANLAPRLATESASKKASVHGLKLAIAHLREGLRYREWEQTEIPEFTCNALYNLACYHARLASHSRFHEKAAVAVLRKAAKLGLIDPEYVCVDFTTEKGDFYTLSNEGQPETKSTLKKVQHELSHRYRMAELL